MMKILDKLQINDKEIDLVLLDLRVPVEMESYFQLFEVCFGKRSNITQETFNWFNLQHPYYDNLTFALIDVPSSKLIACYGLLPGDANVNGQLIKYMLCTNVMTHPGYAGQGLFTKIGAEALSYAKNRGATFALGVPNQQAVRGHLKVGWEVVNEIRFFEASLTNTPIEKQNIEAEVNHIQSFNDYEYFDMLTGKYGIYFNRTLKWMKWRLSKPYNDYFSLSVSAQGNMAFLVLKKYFDKSSNISKMHVVDFGYENLDTFYELIQFCLGFSQKMGFDLVNIWQYDFNTEEAECLTRLGFVKTDRVNPIIIHKMSNVITIPDDSWHLTLFDNDVY